MRKQLKLLTVLVLLALAAFPLAVKGDIEVGVRKGDWIEYIVVTTGHLQDHDAQWARMEVVNVLGPTVNLNVTTQFTNGTFLIENVTLNLETGQLGDDFIIPADLSPGGQFYDARIGNITIDSSEMRTYAGATREVLTGNTLDTTFYWDKQTGMLVEASSSYSVINFTIKTVTDKTNMWQPQASVTNLALTYALVAGFLIAIIIIILLAWRRRSRRT